MKFSKRSKTRNDKAKYEYDDKEHQRERRRKEREREERRRREGNYEKRFHRERRFDDDDPYGLEDYNEY